MTAFAVVGARLLDPASGLDAVGAVLIQDGRIVDVAAGGSAPSGVEIIDAAGRCLAPGLIDVRVKTGEPGAEPKETLKSASLAAAAGGVTSIVVQPDVDPAVDDPAMVDFIHRRGAALDLVRVLAAGALTKGCLGDRMAEIGLMDEAGAAYFTDGDRTVINTRTLQRVMSYAGAFDALVAVRPVEPWLGDGTVATASDNAAWLGLPAAPALAERIQLDRDLALAELTGARLLIDLISTEAALESLDRARARGLDVAASVSINHLCFNDLDAGDWRTFYRLDPPLRAESDRLAMIEGVRDGRIEVITSAHSPAPAEDKRRPFAQAAPGAVGLETLLSAALSLHHEHDLTLLEVLRPLTLGPAELLGLDGGRLTAGAPADLVLFDPNAPIVVDAAALRSKSRNSPFDGRRLQGKVAGTWVGGRRVFG
jgi:dihydroorotase